MKHICITTRKKKLDLFKYQQLYNTGHKTFLDVRYEFKCKYTSHNEHKKKAAVIYKVENERT